MSRVIVRHPPENRLPVPDWGREGETWRVEPEPGGWGVMLDDEYLCSWCHRSAIVVRPARTYGGRDLLLCSQHVREQRMWIEGGRLVSWCLRP